MRKLTTLVTRSTLLLALIAAVALAAGRSEAVARTAASGPAGGSTSQYEINFMKMMIGHHETAVVIATACQEQGMHSALLMQCHMMVESQAGEIQTMRMYLQDWYGMNVMPNVPRSMLRFVTATVPYAGKQFDRIFLNNIIRHHQMAIMMARPCLQRAAHTDLKTACSNIISSQSKEIAIERGWLCKWYRQCSGK